MKRILSITLMLAMMLSFAACGGTAGNSETPAGSGTGADSSVQNPNPDTEISGNLPEDSKPDQTDENAVAPLSILRSEHYLDEWEEDTLLCSVEWQSLILDEKDAVKYPKLAERLHKINSEADVGGHDEHQLLLDSARTAVEESREFFGGFTYSSAYCVQRADNRVFSVREDAGEYAGGVHPIYWASGLNLDPVTGEELALTDVLTDTERLPELLTGKIREKYEFDPFDSLQEQLEGYALEEYTWTLGYQGITFYFSPYEIAPYAAGLLSATIWFDEALELFREEYLETPEGGYAVELPLFYEIELDLDKSDGQRDTLQIVRRITDEYGTSRLSIQLNGREFNEEEYILYKLYPHLVCLREAGSERYFLYVQVLGEGDYRSVYTYDINAELPVRSAELPGTGLPGRWDEDAGDCGVYYTQVLNDPEKVVLSTRINMLGTMTGTRTYTGTYRDGTLQPETEYYHLPADFPPIVSTVPLTVGMQPGMERKELPAGTAFYFLRTDNETYLDMVLEDGRECRLDVVRDGWEILIDGVSERDCFETLLYAG